MSEDSQVVRVQHLLSRFNSDEPQAFDDLFSFTQARLTRLARAMLKSYPVVRRWEGTDDIISGASMRLLRALQAARPKTARHYFRLAALQIRRELIDLARKHSGPEGLAAHHETHDPASGLAPVENASDSTHDPARLTDWTVFHEQAGALPDEASEVFDLIYYDGLTQAEAARLLDVSEKTVKRRWRDAKLALYNALGGRLPGI